MPWTAQRYRGCMNKCLTVWEVQLCRRSPMEQVQPHARGVNFVVNLVITMSEFPIKVGDYSVVNIYTGAGSGHPLYAITVSPTTVQVLNIPPFYNRSSLYAFFTTFGPISKFSYNKADCCAHVEYRIETSIDALISTPMTVSYSFPIPKASFSQIVADSRKTWLKDADALKKESEEALQKYFEEKLHEDQDTEDEDDGEWTTVRPKKRCVR
nr:expressed conserved protein [Hymenolepis microstoma]